MATPQQRWIMLQVIAARYHGERWDTLSAQLDDPLDVALSLLDVVFEQDQGWTLTRAAGGPETSEPI